MKVFIRIVDYDVKCDFIACLSSISFKEVGAEHHGVEHHHGHFKL